MKRFLCTAMLLSSTFLLANSATALNNQREVQRRVNECAALKFAEAEEKGDPIRSSECNQMRRCITPNHKFYPAECKEQDKRYDTMIQQCQEEANREQ